MASNHTKTLVVGLILGLALLLVLVFLLFVFVRYRHLQSELSSSKLGQLGLKQTLAKYTEAGKKELPRLGDVGSVEISAAASQYYVSMNMLQLTFHAPAECPDTLDRIENIIFPKSRSLPLTHGEDFTIFPNPHHYTAAEIFKLLQNRVTRGTIASHIIYSVLEKYTVLTPVRDVAAYSLLPFRPNDIIDLYNLRSRLRGVELIGNLNDYIDRFPPCNRIHRAPGNPERQFIRNFIEELFGPYFGGCTPEQIAQRNRGLERVLDSAVNFGYLATCVAGETLHVWGERQEGHTLHNPTLLYQHYADGRLIDRVTMIEGNLAPWGI